MNKLHRAPLALNVSFRPAVAISISLGLSLLLGCSTEFAGAEFGGASAELAFPGQSGPVETAQFDLFGEVVDLSYEVIDNQRVYQGDIILGPAASHSVGGQALAAVRKSRLWPGGVVYYRIDPALPNQQRVHQAIAHWEAHTPIRFQVAVGQHHVLIAPGEGCSSAIGFQDDLYEGPQPLTLGKDCDAGVVVHELGHTVGLYHTQSRSDRDLHVRVHYDNIEPKHRHNYDTFEGESFDLLGGRNLGEYDTGSVMHYGSSFFAIDLDKPTMTRIDGSPIVPNRDVLAPSDIENLALLYGASPVGSLDRVTESYGQLRVSGWAADGDSSDSISVHAYVNGEVIAASDANRPRPDVARVHPGFGPNHGFDLTLTATAGQNRVCVFGINDGGGANRRIGCKSVNNAPESPIGAFDFASTVPSGVRVRGWAIDRDTTESLAVHVYVDGALAGSGRASRVREDVARVHPGAGPRHGFDFVVPGSGARVCVFAINVGAPGTNTRIGCRDL